MEVVIYLLFAIGIASVCFALFQTHCPPPTVVYKYVPMHPLDVQYSERNVPSQVYKDMFESGSPWIGGFKLESKTFQAVESKN